MREAELDHLLGITAVLPCALFHYQLQEVEGTGGWFLWVTSEVVLNRPATERK